MTMHGLGSRHICCYDMTRWSLALNLTCMQCQFKRTQVAFTANAIQRSFSPVILGYTGPEANCLQVLIQSSVHHRCTGTVGDANPRDNVRGKPRGYVHAVIQICFHFAESTDDTVALDHTAT